MGVSYFSIEKTFEPDDFEWPQLLELLDSGEIDNILIQESDWVFLTLIYLKYMDKVFADADLNMFIDPVCFTNVYKPVMKSKIESAMGSHFISKVIADIVKLILNYQSNIESFQTKYPFVSKIFGEIIDQIPSGNLDRLMYIKNFRQNIRDRARKDAITLMTVYKCGKSGVTKRIYNNAYSLLDRYTARGFNN